ncbi:MAG TPA: hypothetical protein VL172_10060, partial [Kofleriaceae bacterium]|nr:hypothetical protein [Kofleriaceae bacterium]
MIAPVDIAEALLHAVYAEARRAFPAECCGWLAARLGLGAVLLGTNVDDLGDHRPGIAAARERGALSPMVDAGLDKHEVRALSRDLGLRTWDKPQLACLSSRFPYGTQITTERLAQVDGLEDELRR